MDSLVSKYRPVFKSTASIQFGLANDVFPKKLEEIFYIMANVYNYDKNFISPAISWLRSMLPPFKKFMIDYDIIVNKLDECGEIYREWFKETKGKQFPIKLVKNLEDVYTAWWDAFNDSGCGLRGEMYVSKDKRIKDAVRRA